MCGKMCLKSGHIKEHIAQEHEELLLAWTWYCNLYLDQFFQNTVGGRKLCGKCKIGIKLFNWPVNHVKEKQEEAECYCWNCENWTENNGQVGHWVDNRSGQHYTLTVRFAKYSLNLNPVLRNIVKITQNKKYFCAACGKCLQIKANLKRHGGGSHSQPHKLRFQMGGFWVSLVCARCGKQFVTKDCLEKHDRGAHERSNIICLNVENCFRT